MDPSIVYTAISLNIACALVNESVRRHVSSHFIKFHRLMDLMGVDDLIMPILLMCQISLPSLHINPDNHQNMEVLFIIIYFGLQANDVITRNMACTFLVDIESNFPGMMRRLFSRQEIESTLLCRLKSNSDVKASSEVNGKETIELLQACSACCRALNMEPSWVGTSWSFPWQYNKRDRAVPDITSIVAAHVKMIEKDLSPTNIHVLALSIGLSTNLMSIFTRNMHQVPLMRPRAESLATQVINIIPRGLQIVIGNQQKVRSISGDESLGGCPKSQMPLVLVSDYTVDLLYETLAFQTLEAIIVFLCVDDMQPYLKRRELFSEIPLSLSVLHLCLQYKHNQNIQRQVMYVLCYFARSAVETQVLVEQSGEALRSSIRSLRADSDVVSQFIYILNIMLTNKKKLGGGNENLAGVRKYNLDIELMDLLKEGLVSPEDIISSLYVFLLLSTAPPSG